MQIAPDRRQRDRARDPERSQLLRIADPRAQQQQRRADRAEAQHDAIRFGDTRSPALPDHRAPHAALLDRQPLHHGTGADREIRPSHRARQIRVGDADPPPVTNRQRVDRRTGERPGFVRRQHRRADRLSGLDERRRNRAQRRPVLPLRQRAASKPARQPGLRPARPGRLRPRRKIIRVALHMGHRMHPSRRAGLRHRAIRPVEIPPFQERPLQRIGDVGIARPLPRFYQMHATRRILRQPRRQHRSGGPGPEHEHVGTGHRLA